MRTFTVRFEEGGAFSEKELVGTENADNEALTENAGARIGAENCFESAVRGEDRK